MPKYIILQNKDSTMKIFYAILTVCLILFSLFLPCTANITQKAIFYTGEEIVVGGYTNYNTDNSVLVEIWPASFGPKNKYDPGMSGGGSVVVPVIEFNETKYAWSANFSSKNWTPDTYMVRAEVISKNYSETALFNLVEPLPITDSGGDNLTIQK